MRGRAIVALPVAAAVGLAVLTTAAASDFWSGAHARLSYPIFRPTSTFGYRISTSGFQPCPGGRRKASLYATYGTYKGVLESKTKGFGIFEGSPRICSDHAEFSDHGKVQIGADRATLGVYCDVPKTCSIAQGRTNGFILLWTRGKTRIQMDSAHLPLAQFLAVARNLAPVR